MLNAVGVVEKCAPAVLWFSTGERALTSSTSAPFQALLSFSISTCCIPACAAYGITFHDKTTEVWQPPSNQRCVLLIHPSDNRQKLIKAETAKQSHSYGFCTIARFLFQMETEDVLDVLNFCGSACCQWRRKLFMHFFGLINYPEVIVAF